MSGRVGSRINMAFIWRKLKRPKMKTETLLGCTYTELIEHLGPPTDIETVELDHIIPLCRYDLEDPIDLMRAFNYKNMQLMSHTMNKYKGCGLPDNATLLNMKEVWPHSWWPVEGEFDESELIGS